MTDWSGCFERGNGQGYSYLGFKKKSWQMSGFILFLILFVILIVIIIVLKNSNGRLQEEYQILALIQHNNYRARHQAPPLTINETLCRMATKCAKYYMGIPMIDHSCKYVGKAGENLYRSHGYFQDGTDQNNIEAAKIATDLWYNEVEWYDWKNPQFTLATGHFSQLVWTTSSQFCMGVSIQNSKAVAVALYYPPGNIGGLFQSRVLPEMREKED